MMLQLMGCLVDYVEMRRRLVSSGSSLLSISVGIVLSSSRLNERNNKSWIKAWGRLYKTLIVLINNSREKTKEISGMTVVVYLIQNSADLHKL